MGLFSKKKKAPVILPELPELPNILDQYNETDRVENSFSQLPNFPSNPSTDQFSQQTIKNAVINEEPQLEMPIQEPQLNLPSLKTAELTNRIQTPLTREPVFIRIDKFEEGLKTFDTTKEMIREIEKLLREIKTLKEKEEEELSLWEKEIQKMKEKIEIINKDIFSKI